MTAIAYEGAVYEGRHAQPLPFASGGLLSGLFPEARAAREAEIAANRRRCPRCGAGAYTFCCAPTGLPASGPHPERFAAGGDAA